MLTAHFGKCNSKEDFLFIFLNYIVFLLREVYVKTHCNAVIHKDESLCKLHSLHSFSCVKAC